MLDSPDDDEINDEHFDDFNDDDDYEGSKKWYNSQWVQFIKPTTLSKFLATLVALHLTPVSQSVAGQSFKTSVASRLASLFNDMMVVIMMLFILPSLSKFLKTTHCLGFGPKKHFSRLP